MRHNSNGNRRLDGRGAAVNRMGSKPIIGTAGRFT
jgi:hypothetical protein